MSDSKPQPSQSTSESDELPTNADDPEDAQERLPEKHSSDKVQTTDDQRNDAMDELNGQENSATSSLMKDSDTEPNGDDSGTSSDTYYDANGPEDLNCRSSEDIDNEEEEDDGNESQGSRHEDYIEGGDTNAGPQPNESDSNEFLRIFQRDRGDMFDIQFLRQILNGILQEVQRLVEGEGENDEGENDEVME
ncbi:hypothetical protein AAG570_007964 [Ranatra chinensis]|uniref:Uncharacterized protein n=1 Tax=Ranatra chinensis TaxID=642074 RepID=A0ABD0Y6N8_9HEMI